MANSTLNIYNRRGQPMTKPGHSLGHLIGLEMEIGDYMFGEKNKAREVLIPPGKCVLWWAGCERVSWKRNYCRVHWREFTDLGDLAPRHLLPRPPQPLCTNCHKRQSSTKSDWCSRCLANRRRRTYRSRHPEKHREWDRLQNERKRGKRSDARRAYSGSQDQLAQIA